jgi:DNA-binding beta-propeller fold protein YncE
VGVPREHLEVFEYRHDGSGLPSTGSGAAERPRGPHYSTTPCRLRQARTGRATTPSADHPQHTTGVARLSSSVQKFTKDGRFILSWGAQGSGRGEFKKPWGVTVDRQGNVYVVDWGNDRVQKFSSEGGYLLSFPSTESSGAALDHPADVAVDSDGDVYVTDWGNMRVQIYDPDGDVLTALYGDATVFSRWGRRRVEADAPVVDAYRRIEDLTPLGRFRRPVSISVDEQDRIIVTDSTRGRLQVYSKERGHPEAVLSI